jgi:hypothetical protein
MNRISHFAQRMQYMKFFYSAWASPCSRLSRRQIREVQRRECALELSPPSLDEAHRVTGGSPGPISWNITDRRRVGSLERGGHALVVRTYGDRAG